MKTLIPKGMPLSSKTYEMDLFVSEFTDSKGGLLSGAPQEVVVMHREIVNAVDDYSKTEIY